MKKKLNKRLVCGATALLLAAAVMLPTSLASAAEEDLKNVLGDADSATTRSTLLAGEKSSLKKDTIEKTIEAYEETYLLGVAADFNVFLQKDFTVTNSDTEGRAAVGGNIDIDVEWSPKKYSIGKGDYDNYKPLGDISGDTSYATFILGGNIVNGTLDDSIYSPGSTDRNYHDKNNSTKKLVVQWGDGDKAKDFDTRVNDKIKEHDNDDIDQTQTYLTEAGGIIDFDSSFDFIKQNSSDISKTEPTGKYTFGTKDGKGATIFEYTGTETQPAVVYFTVTADDWEKYKDNPVVVFKVPTLDEPVVHPITGEAWNYPYIIVNVEGSGEISLANPSNNEGNKITFVNDTQISTKNNMLGTESIIYNFPKASEVIIGNNFQGNILAPNAHVTDWYTKDKSCNHGHLSGALIAQSFEGATQFGYRPCRAPFSLIKKDEKIEKDLTFTKEWSGCSTDILPSAETFKKWLTVKEGGETLTLDTDYTIEVDAVGTEWTVTVTILDYNDDAVYTVTETLADGYEEAFTSSGDVTLGTKDAKIIITNTLKDIDSVTVTVNKKWVEKNNPNTPATHGDVTANVEITCGSEPVYDEDITLTDPDWSWTYPDELPAYEWVKNSDGTLSKNELTYDVDVTEVTIGGYITTYDTKTDGNNITVTITNTYNYGQLLGKLTVNKNWEGYEGLGGHPNISFELTDSAGKSYSGKWTTGDTVYVFDNLPVYDGENLMEYTLSETISAKNNDFNKVTIVKNPFTLSQNGDDFTAEATVTNEYIAYDPLKITKIWDTSANSSAVIPNSIDVEITGKVNGDVVIEKSLTLETKSCDDYTFTKDGNTWTYTIDGLQKYYLVNGEPCEISYQIKETNIEGFTSSAENPVDFVDGAVTITNTADKIEESSDDSDSSESSSDIDTEDSDGPDITDSSDDTSDDDTSSSESDNDSGLGNQDASNGSSGGVGTGTGSNSKNDNSPKTGRTVGALMLAATALSMAVVASKKKKS